MGSVDKSIQNEAKRYQKEIEGANARRLERLRELLEGEVYNMLERARAVNHTKHSTKDKELNAKWLHQKSFDQTYRDYGPKSKRIRTRIRFERLLQLCGGDKKLLQDEYNRALNKYFPVIDARYEWGARLASAQDGRITMFHGWRRIKKV